MAKKGESGEDRGAAQQPTAQQRMEAANREIQRNRASGSRAAGPVPF